MLDERYFSKRPDRMLMLFDEDHDIDVAESLSMLAVQHARVILPKISGRLAGTIRPAFGTRFWGLFFPDRRVWFLEQGTNPFTMNSLAGKTIPMWVDDQDGSEAKLIGPKAERRITVDGRHQTLIFRRAAKKGQRKMALRKGQMKSVPMSYPGAPGRISNRLANGQIGTPNGGVRWRHPGIGPRHYLNHAMEEACLDWGLEPSQLLLVDAATFSMATRA